MTDRRALLAVGGTIVGIVGGAVAAISGAPVPGAVAAVGALAAGAGALLSPTDPRDTYPRARTVAPRTAPARADVPVTTAEPAPSRAESATEPAAAPSRPAPAGTSEAGSAPETSAAPTTAPSSETATPSAPETATTSTSNETSTPPAEATADETIDVSKAGAGEAAREPAAEEPSSDHSTAEAGGAEGATPADATPGTTTPGDPAPLLIDPATGLFSEDYFNIAIEARMAAARRHLRPVGVVLLDVVEGLRSGDGRPADATVVAQAVRETLREADTACRRPDGRFALLLEDTPENGAIWTVERIRRRLVEHDPAFTVWAGVACYPAHAFDKESILRAAGAALDAARDWHQDRIEVAIAE